MRKGVWIALAVALMAVGAHAQNFPYNYDAHPQSPQINTHEIAPATAVADTTFYVASGDTVTFYFGFLSNWWKLWVYDDPAEVAAVNDASLRLGGAHTVDTLRVASSRAASGTILKIDTDYWPAHVDSSGGIPYFYDSGWERIAGLAVTCTSGDSSRVHIRAGGRPLQTGP